MSALRAEWAKATTLRSTWLTLLVYVVAVAGIGAGVVASVGDVEAAEPDHDPAVIAFYGLNFGHVAVVVLAVLLTAGEYARQTVHTSLLAVPRRGAFLAAKLTVGAGLVLPTAAVTAVATLLVTQAVLGAPGVSLSTPGMLRATVAAALYPTLLAVVCMAAGLLLRDQALALGLLVPFLFLVSPLLELVPGLQRAAVFLPDRAGAVAVRLHARPVDVFGPLAGLGVLALWAAAAALLAWWALRRRDA
ncbi:ABC transporter permease [Geodermatophilus sp. SYSU D01036]